MSIKVMASIWENSKQRGTALLMLLAIADNANEYGEAWPSIDHLAEKCRMKRRNAQLLLKELEESGELLIARQEGANTPHGKTNMFTVVTPGALSRHGVQSSTPHAKDYTPGVQNPVARGAKSGMNGVQSSTPRTIIEPSGTKNDDDVGAMLEALTLSPNQSERAIAAAVVARGSFTCMDVDHCRQWLVENPFDKNVATLYGWLVKGKLPPLKRTNNAAPPQPVLTMADVKRQEAELMLSDPEFARLKEEIARSGW